MTFGEWPNKLFRRFVRRFTRFLFWLKSDTLIKFFRPTLAKNIIARNKRNRLRKKRLHDELLDEMYSQSIQDASGWPGCWAEITPVSYSQVIFPKPSPILWDVQRYDAELSKRVLPSEAGTKPVPGRSPFARVTTLEAALAAASMHGLEVRAYCCRSGCNMCEGRGYRINTVTECRPGFNYFEEEDGTENDE